MGQAEALDDRLPWLPNEPLPPSRHKLPEIAGWIAAAILVAAAAAYLLLARDADKAPSRTPPATATIALPRVRPAETQPRGASDIEGAPEIAPTAAPPVALPEIEAAPPDHAQGSMPASKVALAPPVAQARTAGPAPRSHSTAEAAVSSSPRPASPLPQPVPKPAFEPPQRYGAIVQVGAFASVDQAKPIWRDMARATPELDHLHAWLIQNRDWNGRPFYQFQVGAASEAEGRALCQSVQRSNFRCELVAIP